MPGRKHHLHQNQVNPTMYDSLKTITPLERHEYLLASSKEVHCKKCGHLLLATLEDAAGRSIDSDFERTVQMCTPCYTEVTKQVEKDKAKAFSIKPIDNWEDFKQSFQKGE